MAELARKVVALLVLFLPIAFQAQTASPTPTPTSSVCENPTKVKFKLTAASGAPIPVNPHFSYTRKNDEDLCIRLEDINPYAYKCSVTTTVTPIKETAVSSFLGTIGGVANVGASTTNPAPTPSATPAKAPNAGQAAAQATPTPCAQQYQAKRQQVEALQVFRDNINHALNDTREAQDKYLLDFNGRIADLRGLSAYDAIKNKVSEISSDRVFDVSQVNVPYDPVVPAPTPTPTPTSVPMDQAIDQLATRAQKLLPHLADDLDASCKKELQATLDGDAAFIGALINSSTSVPSAVSTWSSQLKAFNAVRTNIRNVQTGIRTELGSRDFKIDTAIHGHQQVVTYTATCTTVALQTISAPDPSGTAPAPTPTPTPAPASSWSHDFSFGVGPFFVLAGGLVVSPLQQITFSTTATPGGSGASANTIIQQQNSSTRILPIAMLHGRYWDLLPMKKYQSWQWIPNYLSVGVTAKSSDNKGTNIEYLFGPSWAFADRQLFFTVGAYAGQQQRLANSLTVGSTTSLSGANLPITQSTIWKAGFAITWAPAGK